MVQLSPVSADAAGKADNPSDDNNEAKKATTVVSISLGGKKKKSKQRNNASSIAHQLQSEDRNNNDGDSDAVNDDDRPPLVIPVQKNTMIRLQDNNTNVEVTNAEDAAAARALEEEPLGVKSGTTTANAAAASIQLTANTTAAMSNNTQNTDTDKYREDLDKLPAPLSTTDDAYERVPIADFGAAVLRGMGWQGEDESGKAKKNDDEEETMPRPHRLGLGAVPKLPDDETNTAADGAPQHRRRPRRMDEYERDKRREKQYSAYSQTIQQQRVKDPQKTLQNNSIVWVMDHNDDGGVDSKKGRQRARMVKLQGVPGLNRIRVRMEGKQDTVDIPKKLIDGLVSRADLEDRPFRDPPSETTEPKISKDTTRRVKKEEDVDAKEESSSKKRRRREKESNKSSKKSKYKDESTSSSRRITWLRPNIRVRIITKRYGKEYYKEKAVVLDVTPAGATLQLSRAGERPTILDGVKETHVETALPKVGGACIVVGGVSEHTKGRLLERNSRTAVLQESENESILTVDLDDIAEWCGGLDDD